ncbi:unnamed protein product [Bursaphelenchus okinawaensis]|uniref:t-SNARE coiled-coil homology domain-containing protein n=1 Tax=Bursaphelenchus okinawaensis TaxID=465554 RepID=A0A811KF12_9BILA|nr:unnamed protein product [Bursaphelenchus okinawaensis]CAG9102715.1 unnamed protein product [Bursaphelenchus okinawaensis]
MANPFDDDDDMPKSHSRNTNVDMDIEECEKQFKELIQGSLASTQRSTAQLDNAEKMVNQTALNLLEQREKLEKTEKNLDEINHKTQLTQRSLNSLKSVFGGFFKNKFSKVPQKPNAPELITHSASAGKLGRVVEEVEGFTGAAADTLALRPSLGAESRNAIKGSRWEVMDNEIDENLGSMSGQLSRLRMLGQALGDEVDDQNKMLDRIQTKAERNDHVVRSQDNQMKKLLGYKPEPVQRVGSFGGNEELGGFGKKLGWTVQVMSGNESNHNRSFNQNWPNGFGDRSQNEQPEAPVEEAQPAPNLEDEMFAQLFEPTQINFDDVHIDVSLTEKIILKDSEASDCEPEMEYDPEKERCELPESELKKWPLTRRWRDWNDRYIPFKRIEDPLKTWVLPNARSNENVHKRKWTVGGDSAMIFNREVRKLCDEIQKEYVKWTPEQNHAQETALEELLAL